MIKTLAAIALTLSFVSAANDKPIAIAIHGGAGTISKAKMTPEVQAQYEAKLAQAVDRGYALLAEENQVKRQWLLLSKFLKILHCLMPV